MDFLAKIVIIGDSSVGKTNLLLRFAVGNYFESHTPTIGVDFKSKVVEIKEGETKKRVKLQLWDTAGQERFRTITQTYYHGASGIVIAYAIDNRKSFVSVKDWLAQIGLHNGDALPKILVGNKTDLEASRQVTLEQGQELALAKGCAFLEVSAKLNFNVQELFLKLASLITYSKPPRVKNMYSSNSDQPKSPTILLLQPAQTTSNCCLKKYFS